MSETRRDLLTLLAAALLVASFVAQGCVFIRANSQTFDEAVHLTAGYSHLATGDFRLNFEDPPFHKLWCALPVYLWYHIPFEADPDDWAKAAEGADASQWRISEAFIHYAPVPAHDLIALGRMPNLFLGACLVSLVGWWSFRLWGRGAALVSMAAAAFEPTLIAHSCVISSDMSVTLFTCLTMYLLWRFVDAPTGLALFGIGVSLGMVVVSKFSALLVTIIMMTCIGAHLLLSGRFVPGAWPGDPALNLRARIVEAIDSVLRIVAIAIVVILPFYFFQGFSTWATGLRTQMNQQTTGVSAFFLGERSMGGWWYYFPVAFAIKTPVGTLALLAAALMTIRMGKALTRRDCVFLLLPASLYLLALTQLRLNIGLRYLLPIYPLLFVFIGHLATIGRARPWLNISLLCVPLVATAASSLANAPHHLAYFNELVGGPSQGRRYLTDSNIDWGQGLIGLKQWLDQEKITDVSLSYFGTARPASYGIRAQALPGFGHFKAFDDLPPDGGRNVLAISVTSLQALQESDFSWLADRKPDAEIGHCILIFDLTKDADAHERLAALYERYSAPRLAAIERRKAQAAKDR